MDIIVAIIITAIPIMAAMKMHVSAFTLGMIGFSQAIVYLVLTPFFGKLCDKLGSKILIIFSSLILMVTCILCNYISGTAHIFMVMAAAGAGFALFWPSVQVWVTKNTEKDLLKSLGVFNIFWSSGLVFGTFLCAVFFRLGLGIHFYFAAASAAIIFLIAVFTKENKKETREEMFPGPGTADDPHLNDKFLKIAWFSNLVAWACLGSIRYLFPKIAAGLDISESALSFMFTFIMVSQTVSFAVLFFTRSWPYKFGFIAFAELIAGAGLLITYFSSNKAVLMAGFSLVGICVSISCFSSLYYSVKVLRNKGSMAGMHEFMVGVGTVLGPLMAGILANMYTLRTPYFVFFIITLAAIVFQYAYLKHGKAENAENKHKA
jgi:MFS family permease